MKALGLLILTVTMGGYRVTGVGCLPAPFPASPTSHFYCFDSEAFATVPGTPKSEERKEARRWGEPFSVPALSLPLPSLERETLWWA